MELYIIGAGSVGGFISYHADDFGDFTPAGFIDEAPSKHGQIAFGLPVLGGLEILLNIEKTVAVAIAVATPAVKSKLADTLAANSNLRFPNLIHPHSWIGKNVLLGKGNIVYPGVAINYETQVADFCTINFNCAIGHNCSLESFCTLSPGVNLGGFTTIGKRSFIGIGASTLQGIRIGKDAVIGGMSLPLKDVPDAVTAVGNPARVIDRSN